MLACRCVLTSKAELRHELLAKVGKELSGIDSWSAERQQALARHLSEAIRLSGGRVEGIEARDAPTKEAAQWIIRQLAQENEALADTILKAKRFEELHVEGHYLDTWLGTSLPMIASSNPRLAAEVYLKVTALYDQAMNTGNVSMYYSRSTTSELLPQIVNHMDRSSPLVTKLLIALIEGEGSEKMAFSRGELSQLVQPVTQEFRKRRDAAVKEKSGALGATKAMHGWLTETFGDDMSPILASAYTDGLRNYGSKQLEPPEQWLVERVAAGEGSPGRGSIGRRAVESGPEDPQHEREICETQANRSGRAGGAPTNTTNRSCSTMKSRWACV